MSGDLGFDQIEYVEWCLDECAQFIYESPYLDGATDVVLSYLNEVAQILGFEDVDTRVRTLYEETSTGCEECGHYLDIEGHAEVCPYNNDEFGD